LAWDYVGRYCHVNHCGRHLFQYASHAASGGALLLVLLLLLLAAAVALHITTILHTFDGSS
jgi:hypothetical protein